MPVTRAVAKPPSNLPGAAPQQTYFVANVDNGSMGANRFGADRVPADRGLVIEFVSVHPILPAGRHPRIEVIGVVDGAVIPFDLPRAFVGTTPPHGDECRRTHPVRVCHDGNRVNGPGIFCRRNAVFRGSGSCAASISGYHIGK